MQNSFEHLTHKNLFAIGILQRRKKITFSKFHLQNRKTAIQLKEKTILKSTLGKNDQLIKSVIPNTFYHLCFELEMNKVINKKLFKSLKHLYMKANNSD